MAEFELGLLRERVPLGYHCWEEAAERYADKVPISSARVSHIEIQPLVRDQQNTALNIVNATRR